MTDQLPLLSQRLKDNPPLKEQEEVLFGSRWLMLGLLTLLTVNSVIQWVFFSAITHTIKNYFDFQSLYAVEFLTVSGMIVFVVFTFPSIWIIKKTSLRTGCLINGCLNTIAAVIKYFAGYSPNTTAYALTLSGQIISSIATSFVLPMPAELAATWFGRNERSSATSIITGGYFLGISLSCFLSAILVGNANEQRNVTQGLKYSELYQTLLSLFLTILVYFLFKSKPSIPPSESQAKLNIGHNSVLTYKESLSKLVRNIPYFLFLIAYGIIFGAMFAFWAIIQEAIPGELHGKNYEPGLIGAVAGMLGVPGMLLSGFWLDKSKTYKFTLVLVSFLTVLTGLAFTLQLKFSTSILGIYIVAGVYGFLVASFISIGLVFGSEITYPVPETVSSGLLFVSSQIFGIIFIIGVSLNYSSRHDVVISSAVLTMATLFASISISFVRSDFKRFAEDQLNNNVN